MILNLLSRAASLSFLPFRGASEHSTARDRKRESRFGILSQATNETVWDWDLVENSVWWNENLNKVFGYSPAEVSGEVSWWSDRIHPEDRERVMSGVSAALASGQQFWSDEYRFRRADGSFAHVLDRGCIVRDSAGKPSRMIGTMLDITPRKQAEEELRARYREQQAINAIATATAGRLQIDEVLKISLEKVLEITGRERGFIRLRNPSTDQLVLVAHCGISEPYARSLATEQAPGSKSRQVFASGRPLVINEVKPGMIREEARREGIQALAWIPLMAKGETVGILNVSTARSRPFDAREIELLQAIGKMIGIAIENARLFERVRQKSLEFESLIEVNRNLTAVLKLEQLLPVIADQARRLLAADTTLFRLKEGDSLVLIGVSGPDPMEFRPRIRVGESISGKAVEENRPIVISEFPGSSLLPDHREALTDAGYRSALAVPLRLKDEPIGAVNFLSKARREFSPDEIKLVSAFADQAAIAIENARLYQETEQREREQEALNIVAAATSRSLRQNELLEVALDKILEVTGRERASIRLRDRKTGRVELVAHRGFSSEEVQSLIQRVPHAPTDSVLATGEPVVVDGNVEPPEPGSLLPRSRSVAWIPIRAAAEIIGVLGISATSRVPFHRREVEFLKSIGSVIGFAIENARLYEEAQARASDLAARNRELETLHEIAQITLTGEDLAEILERILERGVAVAEFDLGMVRVLDPTGRVLEPMASRGYRSAENIESHRHRGRDPSGARVIHEVMSQRRAAVTQLDATDGMRTLRREGVATAVVVPVRSGDRVFGVMHLGSRTRREVNAEQLRLFEAIGSQIGIAVQKARLREALEQKVGELARSNAELEQFAYVASHDLQEPLRMVESYTKLLAKRYRGKLDRDAQEFIDFAVDGATRMQRLINDLLAYSRLGTRAKEFQQVDCGKVFDQALANLKVTIEQRQARVTRGELPVVAGDDVQLTQLFQNLIGNAIKFCKDRPPEVHVSATREGGEWIFSVRDNGIGIEPQYRERIFAIFQRLHRRDEYPGTGIGLAVCKKVVERHGGRIWVDSEPGRGSTFYFTILDRGGERACAA